MWSKGTIEVNGIEFKYEVKRYVEPSEEYGINGGRISKLYVSNGGYTVISYDRGWDEMPVCDISERVFEILLKKFN